MQNSQRPTKWFVPFAADDVDKVEIPITTPDPGRASQSLGFPPLTMQPPESGGVPPQGEDFNGAMNQVARFVWWAMAGGSLPFDASWSADPTINGYPLGARIPSSDLLGQWINAAENNTNDPDTVGTNWLPGPAYGLATIAGLTGGTVNLTFNDAAKDRLVLTGTLTSNCNLVVPNWVKFWTVSNLTTGAFTLTIKTALGSGVVIPQNGSPTLISCGGTNVIQQAYNIAPALLPNHAVPMAQAAGVVGDARNVTMNIAAASASATLTADEIIVETALGGTRYCLPSFSKVINLATTGAGGMDTGAAPVSGFVAVYAIYNPTTGVSALLATNATSVTPTNVYSGGNMPSGYSASALVSTWRTNGSSQFIAGVQTGRTVSIPGVTALNSSVNQASFTSLSLTSAVPRNAKSVNGSFSVANTATVSQTTSLTLASDTNGSGSQIQTFSATSSSGFQTVSPFSNLTLATLQTLYYTATSNASTPTYTISVSGYTF